MASSLANAGCPKIRRSVGSVLFRQRITSACLRAKQNLVELLLAQHPPEFPKSKERNKCAKHNNGTTPQLIEAYVVRSYRHIRSMDKPFHHFLDHMKAEHQ